MSHIKDGIYELKVHIVGSCCLIGRINSLHHFEVFSLKPLIAKFNCLDGIHLNEGTNIFEDKVLHLLKNILLVVVHQDIGLDALEPSENVLFNGFDPEEHR